MEFKVRDKSLGKTGQVIGQSQKSEIDYQDKIETQFLEKMVAHVIHDEIAEKYFTEIQNDLQHQQTIYKLKKSVRLSEIVEELGAHFTQAIEMDPQQCEEIILQPAFENRRAQQEDAECNEIVYFYVKIKVSHQRLINLFDEVFRTLKKDFDLTKYKQPALNIVLLYTGDINFGFEDSKKYTSQFITIQKYQFKLRTSIYFISKVALFNYFIKKQQQKITQIDDRVITVYNVRRLQQFKRRRQNHSQLNSEQKLFSSDFDSNPYKRQSMPVDQTMRLAPDIQYINLQAQIQRNSLQAQPIFEHACSQEPAINYPKQSSPAKIQSPPQQRLFQIQPESSPDKKESQFRPIASLIQEHQQESHIPYNLQKLLDNQFDNNAQFQARSQRPSSKNAFDVKFSTAQKINQTNQKQISSCLKQKSESVQINELQNEPIANNSIHDQPGDQIVMQTNLNGENNSNGDNLCNSSQKEHNSSYTTLCDKNSVVIRNRHLNQRERMSKKLEDLTNESERQQLRRKLKIFKVGFLLSVLGIAVAVFAKGSLKKK